MQQDRKSTLVMLRPTQDTDVSSSLALRANGTEETLFVDWRNDDSTQECTPWLENFDKSCRRAVGSKSFSILQNLLDVYLRNISSCSSSKEHAKLRDHMSATLMFFHLY